MSFYGGTTFCGGNGSDLRRVGQEQKRDGSVYGIAHPKTALTHLPENRILRLRDLCTKIGECQCDVNASNH
jgi:hypothetical protein